MYVCVFEVSERKREKERCIKTINQTIGKVSKYKHKTSKQDVDRTKREAMKKKIKNQTTHQEKHKNDQK